MRFLTLLAVLACSTAVGQDVIYATRSCANGQCRMVSDTSTAQGVAEACARSGRLQHLGGWNGYEGLGMASTREGAYRRCCFASSGMPDADVGYAQTSGGMWVCCRRYGRR